MLATGNFLRRRGRLHTALFIAIGLTVGGLAVMSYGFHLFERVELSTVDARFAIGGNAAIVGARAANGNYLPDADSVIRRFPYEIQQLETFPVVAAERAMKRRLAPGEFPQGQAWIDFVGPPGAVPFISYSHVLRGTFDPRRGRGKVVVVGVT